MKILLIPLLSVLTPVAALFFLLRYLNKTKRISALLKIALGLIFIPVGLLATYMAVVVSIKGMIGNGITCATGAVAFIPLGLLVNVIGIPFLLVSFQKKFREPKPGSVVI
jgi:hypothetical protein